MVIYHINKDGEPSVCKASKTPCPLGGETGEENHFNTLEEAQSYADELNEKQFGILSNINGNNDSKMIIKDRKDFISALVKGPVPLDDSNSYRIIRMNEEEVDMPKPLKEDLEKKGLYNNSYVGVILPSSISKEKVKTSYLPVFGRDDSYETKHLKRSFDEAILTDLRDKNLNLLERVIEKNS